jgi:hypothetical protein
MAWRWPAATTTMRSKPESIMRSKRRRIETGEHYEIQTEENWNATMRSKRERIWSMDANYFRVCFGGEFQSVHSSPVPIEYRLKYMGCLTWELQSARRIDVEIAASRRDHGFQTEDNRKFAWSLEIHGMPNDESSKGAWRIDVEIAARRGDHGIQTEGNCKFACRFV